MKYLIFIAMMFVSTLSWGQVRTTHDFASQSIDSIATVYFTHPDALPDRSMMQNSIVLEEEWQVYIVDAGDSSTVTAWLETSQYTTPTTNQWVTTSDTVAIVGTGSGLIKPSTFTNAKNRRVKVTQTTAGGIITADAVSRSVIVKRE